MIYKIEEDTPEPTATEHLQMICLRAYDAERLARELLTLGLDDQKSSVLVGLANRHLLNCLEVLKGIKFGRA